MMSWVSVIAFEKIYERDIDFLLMEEFTADRTFAQLFLDKVGLGADYVIEKVVHSLSDADGESDITFVLRYPTQKVAVLIEDKIDAPTMKEQSSRYQRRAEAARQRGEYASYYVLLTAPAAYHKEHLQDADADYAYRVTYEELIDHFEKSGDARAVFQKSVLLQAVQQKKKGYLVQENAAVTAFWTALRCYCADYYPSLHLLGEDTPKGTLAGWPEFRTALKNVKVIYKASKGVVDLEFPGYGDRIGELKSRIEKREALPGEIWKTGKSASIRLKKECWRLDFKENFTENKEIVDDILKAVGLLCDFAQKLNYCELY